MGEPDGDTVELTEESQEVIGRTGGEIGPRISRTKARRSGDCGGVLAGREDLFLENPGFAKKEKTLRSRQHIGGLERIYRGSLPKKKIRVKYFSLSGRKRVGYIVGKNDLTTSTRSYDLTTEVSSRVHQCGKGNCFEAYCLLKSKEVSVEGRVSR